MNTWNIIFIALDVNNDVNDYTDEDKDKLNAIKVGWNSFINNYKSLNSSISEKINVTALQFFNNSNIGVANVYKNNFDTIESTICCFNCYSAKSYSDFFKSCIIKNKDSTNQKYLFIFLAHSFGGGFTFHFVKDNIENSPTFLSLPELQKGISDGFREQKLDAMLALNCTLQSIEVNYIFRNNVNILIGAQQPIRINAISYTQLFKDFVILNDYADEIIFCKFISDLFQNSFESIDLNNKESVAINSTFGLSITWPEKAKIIFDNLDRLTCELLKELKGNVIIDDLLLPIRNAEKLCEDPTSDDVTNIIDAIHFFINLRNNYLFVNKITLANIVTDIIVSIRTIHIYQSVSPFLTGKVSKFNNAFYIPFGIGIFMPKVKSATTETILELLKFIYSQSGNNITNGINWFYIINQKYIVANIKPIAIYK